jgi:hypothetical protein
MSAVSVVQPLLFEVSMAAMVALFTLRLSGLLAKPSSKVPYIYLLGTSGFVSK